MSRQFGRKVVRPQNPSPREMTERMFQERVVTQAKLNGWLVYHTHDSRHSEAGFPDLVMIRGSEMVVAELKSATGKTTKAQEVWLRAFADVGHPIHHIRAYVWKPSDQEEIDEVLRRRR